jgi:hypothetical protein
MDRQVPTGGLADAPQLLSEQGQLSTAALESLEHWLERLNWLETAWQACIEMLNRRQLSQRLGDLETAWRTQNAMARHFRVRVCHQFFSSKIFAVVASGPKQILAAYCMALNIDPARHQGLNDIEIVEMT